MQVYRDLSILTARPSAAEMETVPHALYGTVDGATAHSVSLWLADAAAEIRLAQGDGLIPIFVGGTGLYFKALTQGLSDIPKVPTAVRKETRAWAEGRSPDALHAELARRDPSTAAVLRPTDPQRLLRALEVHAATGESLVAFQSRRETPVLDPGTALAMTLTVDRAALWRRIEGRFDDMMAAGALDEVARLAERRLDPSLPVMRAIGVPPLLQYVAGHLALDRAVAEAKTASRQYVKRQETFLRHQLPAFHAVAADLAEAALSQSLV